ncbi:hypothetical protein V6O07_15690, partial [Arthrospira platensis SPKY2]
GQINLLGRVRAGTDSFLFSNGQLAASEVVTNTPTSNASFGIGSWHNDSQAAQRLNQGDIAEVVVFDNEISESNRNALTSYFQNKYSLDLGGTSTSHETSITKDSSSGSIK